MYVSFIWLSDHISKQRTTFPFYLCGNTKINFLGILAVRFVIRCIVIGMAAQIVGNLRKKHKITPPEMNGPPDFLRAIRAQQNCIEFSVTFQILLWTAGIFCHQVPAAILGLGYIYARHRYVRGYIQDASLRVKPFWMSVRALQGLCLVAISGILNILLQHYTGVDIVKAAIQRIFAH